MRVLPSMYKILRNNIKEVPSNTIPKAIESFLGSDVGAPGVEFEGTFRREPSWENVAVDKTATFPVLLLKKELGGAIFTVTYGEGFDGAVYTKNGVKSYCEFATISGEESVNVYQIMPGDYIVYVDQVESRESLTLYIERISKSSYAEKIYWGSRDRISQDTLLSDLYTLRGLSYYGAANPEHHVKITLHDFTYDSVKADISYPVNTHLKPVEVSQCTVQEYVRVLKAYIRDQFRLSALIYQEE